MFGSRDTATDRIKPTSKVQTIDIRGFFIIILSHVNECLPEYMSVLHGFVHREGVGN